MAASYLSILAALDSGLKTFNDANLVVLMGVDGLPIYNNTPMDVAWENTRYVPQIGRPYQEPTLLSNDTLQPGNGVSGTTYDHGFYQISLFYPRDEGAGAALGRADLLRSFFKRGVVLSSGGVTVQVEHTPSISGPMNSPDWYKRAVSVPYFLYS